MIASRPKDLQDVESLLISGARVDASKIERTLREFDSLLDTDRASEWRQLFARIRDVKRR